MSPKEIVYRPGGLEESRSLQDGEQRVISNKASFAGLFTPSIDGAHVLITETTIDVVVREGKPVGRVLEQGCLVKEFPLLNAEKSPVHIPVVANREENKAGITRFIEL